MATGITSIELTCGLINHQGLYLTAETFGNQLSVTGKSLRAKQMWTFEPIEGCSGYLRSPHKKYLVTDKNGAISCVEEEERTEDHLFAVMITSDGKWSFKDKFDKYLTASGNTFNTKPKEEGKQEAPVDSQWSIHLACHPQCNMKSVSRKRYVRSKGDEMNAIEDIPWGEDSVITLEFDNGKYAIRDSKGRFLDGVTGGLVATYSDNSRYVLCFKGTDFGFKCVGNNQFLSVQGNTAKLMASGKKETMGKDERFKLEESKAQCTFIASNGKYLSVKQGNDVIANIFDEPEDTETFQIVYEGANKDKIELVTNTAKIITATEKAVKTEDKASADCSLVMEWHNEKVAFKSTNGKYITSTSGGKLTSTSTDATDPSSLFICQLVNRTLLALRGEHGFVGTVSTMNKLQCNRGCYENLQVTSENGKYKLKTASGKFWKIQDSIVIADSAGDDFIFVLHGKGKMAIRAPNGKFLKGDNNGNILASDDEITKLSLWEY